MKNYEIKKIGPFSAFKVALYFTAVISLLFFIIGLIIAIIGGFTGNTPLLIAGIIYIFMPIVMAGMYGAMAALFALIYNWLAKKFGGLEINIEEKPEKIREIPDQSVQSEIKNDEME